MINQMGPDTIVNPPKAPQAADFITRYENAYRRFFALKEKGQAVEIHEAFGDLNYLIRLSGKDGVKFMDLIDDEAKDEEEYRQVRENYSVFLDSLKEENPKMLAALEDKLSDFEQKLTEKEAKISSYHDPLPAPSDTQKHEDGENDDEPMPSSAPEFEAIQRPVLSPGSIYPQVLMPEIIEPPFVPPPIEALRPPTETELKDEELTRTERQEFLLEEIRKEAEKITDALKKPKNFDIANIDEYQKSLRRMQAQRQELFLNIQNNLPRGSFVLGWRMTQFMRANKLLQNEAENFMDNVSKDKKPNVDRFKIAEKLYRNWEHKLYGWYDEHRNKWNLDDLVIKKVEKYKNKPQKLYNELNKASGRLDRRSEGVLEDDFWDILENFNLLYRAFREIMSITPEAQDLVNIYSRQLARANTLRKIAETGDGDLAKALSDYKSGVGERKIKVKIKSDGRKYFIEIKHKGGD